MWTQYQLVEKTVKASLHQNVRWPLSIASGTSDRQWIYHSGDHFLDPFSSYNPEEEEMED